MVCAFGKKTPDIARAAFVAENASVIGQVTLGAGASVWFGAVLRGDEGSIAAGDGTNIQDNAVLHCDSGGALLLGKNVTVGHGAVVHGCTVGDGSLIGMHATLLNRCVIGKGCIVGAGALVPEGMVMPDGALVLGVPARVVRSLRAEQAEDNLKNAELYTALGQQYAAAQKAGGNAGFRNL